MFHFWTVRIRYDIANFDVTLLTYLLKQRNYFKLNTLNINKKETNSGVLAGCSEDR